MDPFIKNNKGELDRLTEAGMMPTPMKVVAMHEFGHVQQAILNPEIISEYSWDPGIRLQVEFGAVDFENSVRREEGIPERKSYYQNGIFSGNIESVRYGLYKRYLP